MSGQARVGVLVGHVGWDDNRFCRASPGVGVELKDRHVGQRIYIRERLTIRSGPVEDVEVDQFGRKAEFVCDEN